MSSTNARRLARLEIMYQADDPVAMTDTEREWLHGLSSSSLLDTVHQFARLMAERRYVHEVGLPPGERSAWVGDWTQALGKDEHDACTRAEVERLAAVASDDLDRALTEWIGVADQESWPAFRNLAFSMDLAGFEHLFMERRQSIDRSRGADMFSSPAWRRAHPSWHPGMDGDAALAFERELLEEAR